MLLLSIVLSMALRTFSRAPKVNIKGDVALSHAKSLVLISFRTKIFNKPLEEVFQYDSKPE